MPIRVFSAKTKKISKTKDDVDSMLSITLNLTLSFGFFFVGRLAADASLCLSLKSSFMLYMIPTELQVTLRG